MKTLALALCAIWILTWDIGEKEKVSFTLENPYTLEQEKITEYRQAKGRKCFDTGSQASDFIRGAPKGKVKNWKLKKCKPRKRTYCVGGKLYGWREEGLVQLLGYPCEEEK